MQKENNTTTSKPRRFTITGEHGNAHSYHSANPFEIKGGDVCIVKPNAPYKDGDIVLVECSCYQGDSPHYHAKFFYLAHGHKYAFRLCDYDRTASGTRHMAGEEKIIIGPVVKVIKKGQREEKAKSTKALKSYRSGFEWSLYGLHDNDTVTVNENGQAKPGQLILVKSKAGSYDDSYFTRCCLVTSDTVRICAQHGEPYDRPASVIIGAVVSVSHEDCTHTKIEALRAKLAELRDDDEHTLNLTKAFEVEREIYDLEHPVEAEEDTDSDEWPDEIGG